MKTMTRVETALLGLLVWMATPANAAGLEKAKVGLQSLYDSLSTIIPIVATIALVVIGVLWFTQSAARGMLMYWAVGVLIVGSAAEAVALLMT